MPLAGATDWCGERLRFCNRYDVIHVNPRLTRQRHLVEHNIRTCQMLPGGYQLAKVGYDNYEDGYLRLLIWSINLEQNPSAFFSIIYSDTTVGFIPKFPAGIYVR